MLLVFAYFCYTSVNVQVIEKGGKTSSSGSKIRRTTYHRNKGRVGENGPVGWAKERSKVAMRMEKMRLNVTRR